MADPAYILDASAVLALMLSGPGAGQVEAVFGDACVSSVTLSEVIAQLQARGVPDEMIDASLADLDMDIVPFDGRQADVAGKLRNMTYAYGLGADDRACLALAWLTKATAVSANPKWRSLRSDIKLMLVAPEQESEP
ncbi:type II toxin-antitoxin system VapC family toxin [Sphingobium sp. CAP-1]|jgi:ribonuclease VapC|uniref:type II toxin-antitoxin system VapC family toxin n=1 Tax=Sphingobium sp. CAP-1 TaxID=2676077 RepID=UPI0012BB2D69|nr:type II toxin-antitoxin system VapC family toxin [Sphingobium sp. CAP-1]QGP81424.1 PIN domain-containing protein [Sphingobium sp. CAP-1]